MHHHLVISDNEDEGVSDNEGVNDKAEKVSFKFELILVSLQESKVVETAIFNISNKSPINSS